MCPFSIDKPPVHNSACKYHLLLFLAGGEAFHTISHVIIAFSGILPLPVFGIDFTQNFNYFAIVTNGLITIALLWWASKVHRHSPMLT
jgi:hypothetical protein